MQFVLCDVGLTDLRSFLILLKILLGFFVLGEVVGSNLLSLFDLLLVGLDLLLEFVNQVGDVVNGPASSCSPPAGRAAP